MRKKIAALFFSLCWLAFSQSAFSQDVSQDELQIGPSTPALTASTSQQAAAKPSKPNGLQPAGQMVWVNGTVKATYPDQPPRILTRGAMVYERDTINTGPNGSGQIAFTDNGMVSLNSNTIFVIEQYYFNQQKPNEGGQAIMNLIKGEFRTITGFVAKAAPANYQMKTPVATIGVRGTDYQGSCPKNPGACAFALIRGVITLTNAAGTAALTPEAPYATVTSFTTKAILSRIPADILGPTPTVSPANAPAPTSGVSGNCGILIN